MPGLRLRNRRRRGSSHSKPKESSVATLSTRWRRLSMTALVALRIDSSAPLMRGRYDAPRLGQCETLAAPHAMKQRHTEPLLERLDLVAHRGLRDVQRVGRTREAQVTRRRLEHDQGIERWQSRRHGRNLAAGNPLDAANYSRPVNALASLRDA